MAGKAGTPSAKACSHAPVARLGRLRKRGGLPVPTCLEMLCWRGGLHAWVDVNVVPWWRQALNQSVDGSHMMVLCTDGRLLSTGRISVRSGRSGASNVFLPVKYAFPTGIKDFMVGAGHTLVVTNDGNVWSFGSDFSGQLGHRFNTSVGMVEGIPEPVATVAAGEGHRCVHAGCAYCVCVDLCGWGSGVAWATGHA